MINVMVSDDERWIRKGIIKMLDLEGFRQQGYGQIQMFEADSVEQSLKLSRSQQIDIVISDVKFPTQDGCTLCEKIYEENPLVKIIMISGYNEFSYVKRALKYKAADYLLKPIDKETLNTTFKKCLDELIVSSKPVSHQQEKRPPAADYKQNAQNVIEDTMAEIRKNYQARYTLTNLAGKYNLSEAYFSHIFKKYAGVSLTAYIMKVKVDKAIELMTTTRYKICDIGEMVGYEDQHYFNKVFRKVTNKSPSEYRAALIKELTGGEEGRP